MKKTKKLTASEKEDLNDQIDMNVVAVGRDVAEMGRALTGTSQSHTDLLSISVALSRLSDSLADYAREKEAL